MRLAILIAALFLTSACSSLRLYGGQRDEAASEAFALYKTIDINVVVAEQTRRYEKLEQSYADLETDISKSKRQAWLDELSYSNRSMSETLWKHVICGLEKSENCKFEETVNTVLDWFEDEFSRSEFVKGLAQVAWIDIESESEFFKEGRGDWFVESQNIFPPSPAMEYENYKWAAQELRRISLDFGRRHPRIHLPPCYIQELVPDRPLTETPVPGAIYLPIELNRQFDRVFKLRSFDGQDPASKKWTETENANNKIMKKRRVAEKDYETYKTTCRYTLESLDILVSNADSQMQSVEIALDRFDAVRRQAAARYISNDPLLEEAKVEELNAELKTQREKIRAFDEKEKEDPDKTDLQSLTDSLETISNIGGFIGIEVVGEAQLKSIGAVVDALEGRDVKEDDIKDKPSVQKAVAIAKGISRLRKIADSESGLVARQNLALLLPEQLIAEAKLARIRKHRQLAELQVEMAFLILDSAASPDEFKQANYFSFARLACALAGKKDHEELLEARSSALLKQFFTGRDSPIKPNEVNNALAMLPESKNNCWTYLIAEIQKNKLPDEQKRINPPLDQLQESMKSSFYSFITDPGVSDPVKEILAQIVGEFSAREALQAIDTETLESQLRLFGYRYAMANAEASIKSWDAVIRGPLMYLAAYYKRGIKAEELAQLATLLIALSGIQVGTN
jgi:hypothetical protein